VLLLGILVIGLFAGWLAQLLLGGGSRIDWGQSLVAGLLGSLLGGLVVSLLAGDGLRLRFSGIIGTIGGAVVVLAIWNAVRASKRQKQQAAALKARRSGRHH
jgi:uncharacterized membrane protein YeaQ/YmgE (transglycosylase-associated protein family)